MNTSKWIVVLLAIIIALLLLLLLIPRLQSPETVQQPEQIPSAPPEPMATFTPVAEPTPTRTPWLKNTPTFTPQVLPTPTPTATVTPVPSPTPMPAYVVNNAANIRSGPGTDFKVVGSRNQGHVLNPLARTNDGQWIQIGVGKWIWSGLVTGNIERIAVTHNIPILPTPIPTATLLPITQTQTAGDCSSDAALEYLLELGSVMEKVERTYKIIGDHYGLASQYPDIVNDKDWIESTSRIINILLSLSSLLEELTPTSGLKELHVLVVEVSDKLLTVAAAISLSMKEDVEYLKISSATLQEILVDVTNMAVWIDSNC